MRVNPVDQAIILAAGMGSRIRGETQPLPKPLVQVGGLSLLKRAVLTAKKAGITRFVIVLGHDGDRVRGAIADDPELADLDLVWVLNERYQLSNGVSVLAARPHIRGEFFLMMADHVVDAEIYKRLQVQSPEGGLLLAVDRKINTIYDMDDATKVQTGPGERIVKIGKTLEDFDAIDTGVFRCAPALFDALQVVLDERGDTSLSDGVQALVQQDKARVVDVGAAWWQDVDTPGSKTHAEKLLFKSLTKDIDGPVSKHINRKISKSLTRLLVNTNVVPNHMTAVGLLVGLAASVVTMMVSPSSLWLIPLGGVLFQLSSAIDGCDGEIARLKFKHSDWGEWFDTVSDDIVNTTYFLAMGVAVSRLTGQAIWWQIGLTTFVVGWIVAGSLYKKLLESGKGTHLAIEWDFQNADDPTVFQRLCNTFMFAAKRDFYAFALMVLSFMGLGVLKGILIASVVVVGVVGFQWLMTATRGAAGRRRELRRAQG